MGSFIGHILPGTLFLLVGVWHIWGSVVRYVSNPKIFRVHVWNPVPGFNGRLKHLELYVISVGAFIDLCVELLLATHLRFFVDGSLNTTYFNNFEHSGMLLMFLIYGVVALFSEKTRTSMEWRKLRKLNLDLLTLTLFLVWEDMILREFNLRYLENVHLLQAIGMIMDMNTKGITITIMTMCMILLSPVSI